MKNTHVVRMGVLTALAKLKKLLVSPVTILEDPVEINQLNCAFHCVVMKIVAVCLSLNQGSTSYRIYNIHTPTIVYPSGNIT